jgi:hypothetical protein
MQRVAAPPTPDLSKWKTDKKITDEELLKILDEPLSKNAAKSKKKQGGS